MIKDLKDSEKKLADILDQMKADDSIVVENQVNKNYLEFRFSVQYITSLKMFFNSLTTACNLFTL